MFRTLATVSAFVGLCAAQAPMPIVPPQLKPSAGKAPANASKPAVAPIVAANPSRAIDLVICLDVSGSMDGLLNAARQNLWAVVNEMATLQPAPELRVALLTYGCPLYGAESGFVAIQTGLTNDLDTVSQKLFALSTNGGDESGDGSGTDGTGGATPPADGCSFRSEPRGGAAWWLMGLLGLATRRRRRAARARGGRGRRLSATRS